MIEENLEVKLLTVWKGEKQRWEESEKRRERVRRKKMQVREKARKSRITGFFSHDLWVRRVEKQAL